MNPPVNAFDDLASQIKNQLSIASEITASPTSQEVGSHIDKLFAEVQNSAILLFGWPTHIQVCPVL